MRSKGAVRVAIGLLLILGIGGAQALPQGQGQPFLLALRGETVIVNYTPGALDRAVHVQRRLELLASDAGRWLGKDLRLRVFILTREEWGALGFLLPFGLPGRIRGSTLAVPALGDAGTIELWTDLLGYPPPPLAGIPMKGTPQEAATLAHADLLSEVETARILLSDGGVQGESAWLHQLLAHLMARTAFERYEEVRLADIGRFFADLGHAVAEPVALDRYAPGLDLEILLWFESRFHDGARAVMETGKKNEAKVLLKEARKNGGVLTEQAFFEFYPEMRSWVTTTFAAEAAGP